MTSTDASADIAQPEGADIDDALARIRRHQAAGRLAAADKLLDEWLTTRPDHPKLAHYKGLNLVWQGEREAGIEMMNRALEKAPEDPVQLCDLGAELAKAGDLDVAIENFQTAVEVAPHYAIAHSNLGGALVMKKDFAKAIGHLEQAVSLEPEMLDAQTNLAMALLQTNRFGRAVDVLFKALAIDPQSVTAHLMLSQALYRRERFESAEHHARRALDLQPGAAEAWLHLGNALSSSGKMQEAAEAYLKIIGRPPSGLMALARLVHMRKTVEESPEFKALKAYLDKSEDMQDEPRATLFFAAGKAFDDLGDYDRAFGYFRNANDIQKQGYPFNAAAHSARVDRLIKFATPELMDRCRSGGLEDLRTIFICGMPRSGTTLMDQMFSRHPQVQAGGELSAGPAALRQNLRLRQALGDELDPGEIGPDDFTRLAEQYAEIVRREGLRAPYVTDKLPVNYQYIGLWSLALPNARFLIMRRHPLDNLLSNYFQHFGRNQPFASDFGNLASVYRDFDRMATHWAGRLPDRVREVRYEDLTADPEGELRATLDFVGLDWAPEMLDHHTSMRQVLTASISQVREPVYSRSVDRWRNYAPHLAPLASELRGYLTQQDLDACGVPRAH